MICIIDPPQALGISGRQYMLSEHDFDKVTTLVNLDYEMDVFYCLKGTLMHIKFHFFLSSRLLLQTD